MVVRVFIVAGSGQLSAAGLERKGTGTEFFRLRSAARPLAREARPCQGNRPQPLQWPRMQLDPAPACSRAAPSEAPAQIGPVVTRGAPGTQAA